MGPDRGKMVCAKGENHISIKLKITTAAIMVVAIVSTPVPAFALNNSNVNSQFDFWNILSPTSPLISTQEQVKRVEIPPSTKPEPAEPKPPEPRKYTVVSGDNLSKIAEEQGTTWPRLWNKNADLKDPDVIQIDQVILIPDESEVLEDRPIPQKAPTAAPGIVSRGPSSGNTYSAGYCTWYVKNRRPDLPNSLGNANTWYARAAAQGLPVGASPRAGAVGTTTAGDLGHVVYVERVNSDGSILISEMNYAGLYSQRTRTASASEFVYIY